MTYTQILAELKAKKYSPVYFLQSDEAFYIDEITNYIADNVLDEASKAFNQVVMYGKETNFKQVMDQARQFPMMASHRVVIVKEAQEMSSIEKLEGYFAQPSESTILVLAHKHKKLDKRKKKVWDALKKHASILETKKIYDNQIPGIISKMSKEKKLRISPQVLQVLAENIGADLSRINNELDKLALSLEDNAEVTLDHVERHVGISKDYNIFELQTAIGKLDKTKVYKIITHFAKNHRSNPIQMHIGSLYNYFTKLLVAKKYMKADNKTFASKVKVSPFFAGEYKSAARNFSYDKLKMAFQLIHQMDKRSKGVEGRTFDYLGCYQEFMYKLFN